MKYPEEVKLPRQEKASLQGKGCASGQVRNTRVCQACLLEEPVLQGPDEWQVAGPWWLPILTVQKSALEMKEAAWFEIFQWELSQVNLPWDVRPSCVREHRRKQPSSSGPPCGTRHVYQTFPSSFGASVLSCKAFLWGRVSHAPAPCLLRPKDWRRAPLKAGSPLFFSTPQITDEEKDTQAKALGASASSWLSVTPSAVGRFIL